MNPSRETASRCPVVATKTFISAIRDAGYKGTAWALAELVDNAYEASATMVEIEVLDALDAAPDGRTLWVADNGSGIPREQMRLALQFGGSTRFNSRQGLGRYGLGLPCSALSQARRVDLYSWQKHGEVWWTYLDIDEIATSDDASVPVPQCIPASSLPRSIESATGTVVALSKCDRLEYKRTSTLIARLYSELGRLFRRTLDGRLVLRLNRSLVEPVDPLFIAGNGLTGAHRFGPPLELSVRVPGGTASSTVRVSFSELPLEEWHTLSNDAKRQYGISKGAGVSVLRAGREIDHGWYFMGNKRRENYDDWWRCEVEFEPVLDELFGVTHTKQRINPTDALSEILTPHIEAAAHVLNARVRSAFVRLRAGSQITGASKRAEHANGLLEPPAAAARALRALQAGALGAPTRITGLHYRIRRRELKEEAPFIAPILVNGCLQLDINVRHAFFEAIYRPMLHREVHLPPLRAVELLLLAYARAECALRAAHDRSVARRLRQRWGGALAAFLG